MERDEAKISVLKEMRAAGMPAGASYICTRLSLSQATVGRLLIECEREGLLEKRSNKGRVLTEKGEQYIEIKARRGAKLMSAEGLISRIEEADRDRLLEALETRKLLEAYTAAAACGRADDREIQNLEAILAEYIYAVNHGTIGNDQDYRFHLAIADLAGNTVIRDIMHMILTNDNPLIQFVFSHSGIIQEQIFWHTSIVEAIRRRDPEAAGEAMREHMSAMIRVLEARGEALEAAYLAERTGEKN